ncbi:MAG: PorP/SprF family type IX secretion system membrane protein [Chitinophagaceae bacterium]|nr:PorP/SprF family type IX secretion system membrane protein [Chitinophagaceae bacterium]
MKKLLQLSILLIGSLTASAQGLHFSQYYNAPMLLNPANTGLLQDNDWRAGVNYRNQWATVPVNYNTFSVFGDLGLFRDKWETSWLGTGLAIYRDVAGNGNLALTRVQGNLAYHVLTGETTSISAGLGASYNQRSVDFSKLTFDVQWDEFAFNRNLPNNETNTTMKSTYTELSAGVNFSYYNNDNLYIKLSAGARNLNSPQESFYGQTNKIGLRPIANIDVVYKAGDKVLISPSVYYTRQKKASELVVGSAFNFNVGESALTLHPNELILGVFYRNKDAIIGTAGYKFRQHRFVLSYDHTISQMNQGNKGIGAFELSLILQGNYRNAEERVNTYGCPRF